MEDGGVSYDINLSGNFIDGRCKLCNVQCEGYGGFWVTLLFIWPVTKAQSSVFYSDGKTDDTQIVQEAFSNCENDGGNCKILFPSGKLATDCLLFCGSG